MLSVMDKDISAQDVLLLSFCKLFVSVKFERGPLLPIKEKHISAQNVLLLSFCEFFASV